MANQPLSITPELQKTLIGLYAGTVRHQTKQGVTVTLTEAEYLTLWTPYRIRKMEGLLAQGKARLASYLRDPIRKPVCGWKRREDKAGMVMSLATARIMNAEEQKRMFQFIRGCTHSAASIQKMSKPHSPARREKMKQSALVRHARARGEI